MHALSRRINRRRHALPGRVGGIPTRSIPPVHLFAHPFCRSSDKPRLGGILFGAAVFFIPSGPFERYETLFVTISFKRRYSLARDVIRPVSHAGYTRVSRLARYKSITLKIEEPLLSTIYYQLFSHPHCARNNYNPPPPLPKHTLTTLMCDASRSCLLSAYLLQVGARAHDSGSKHQSRVINKHRRSQMRSALPAQK